MEVQFELTSDMQTQLNRTVQRLLKRSRTAKRKNKEREEEFIAAAQKRAAQEAERLREERFWERRTRMRVELALRGYFTLRALGMSEPIQRIFELQQRTALENDPKTSLKITSHPLVFYTAVSSFEAQSGDHPQGGEEAGIDIFANRVTLEYGTPGAHDLRRLTLDYDLSVEEVREMLDEFIEPSIAFTPRKWLKTGIWEKPDWTEGRALISQVLVDCVSPRRFGHYLPHALKRM